MAASGKFPKVTSALNPHPAMEPSVRVGPTGTHTRRTTTVTEEHYDPTTDILRTTQTETTVVEVVTVTAPTGTTTPPPPVPDKTYFWITTGVWDSGRGCYHTNKQCQGKVIAARMRQQLLSDIMLKGEKLRACRVCAA